MHIESSTHYKRFEDMTEEEKQHVQALAEQSAEFHNEDFSGPPNLLNVGWNGSSLALGASDTPSPLLPLGHTGSSLMVGTKPPLAVPSGATVAQAPDMPEYMHRVKDMHSFMAANAKHFVMSDGPLEKTNPWWASQWYMGSWFGTHIPSLMKSMNRTAELELMKSNPNLFRMIQAFK